MPFTTMQIMASLCHVYDSGSNIPLYPSPTWHTIKNSLSDISQNLTQSPNVAQSDLNIVPYVLITHDPKS